MIKIMLGVVFACGVILSPLSVRSQSVPELDGESFILDYKKYIGKRVTVAGCLINGARLEFAGCFVGAPVMINVGYGKADRDVRKRAMAECAQADITKRCFAKVTGKVRGSMTGQVIGLDDATLVWSVP